MQSNMVFGETEGSKEFTRGNSEELIDSKRETTGPAAEDFEKNVKDSNSALIGQNKANDILSNASKYLNEAKRGPQTNGIFN